MSKVPVPSTIRPIIRADADRDRPEFLFSSNQVLWHDAKLPKSLVDDLWDNPDSVMECAINDHGSILKDGDRCTVARLEHNKKHMVFKRYNQKDAFHTATHLCLRSRAKWSWISAELLLAADISTPKPLACLERRRLRYFRLGSYLLTEFVTGRSLAELLESGDAAEKDWRDYAEQFVSIWQALGYLRIGHGDMKATNFIVDPENKLWLVDLDGMRVYKSSSFLRRERRNDLSCFMRNWQGHASIASIFKSRLGTG